MNEQKASRQRQILAKNLKSLMGKHGKNSVRVAEDNGWNPTTVRSWLNCERYPRLDKIQQLADYFNVSRRDLLEDVHTDELNPRTIKIPIIDIIRNKEEIFSNENISGYSMESPEQPGQNVFYIRIFDSSMAPTIPAESLIKCIPADKIREDKLMILLTKDSPLATVRRVKILDNDLYHLKADNLNIESVTVKSQDIKILGIAISFYKELH